MLTFIYCQSIPLVRFCVKEMDVLKRIADFARASSDHEDEATQSDTLVAISRRRHLSDIIHGCTFQRLILYQFLLSEFSNSMTYRKERHPLAGSVEVEAVDITKVDSARSPAQNVNHAVNDAHRVSVNAARDTVLLRQVAVQMLPAVISSVKDIEGTPLRRAKRQFRATVDENKRAVAFCAVRCHCVRSIPRPRMHRQPLRFRNRETSNAEYFFILYLLGEKMCPRGRKRRR